MFAIYAGDMAKPRDISSIVPGVTALKALAHPDRLRILGSLRVTGPSTASALARQFGLNSGATSYHLRQLATHGFIEEATDLGNARERWWRAAHESTFYETSGMTGHELEAGLAFSQAVLSSHASMMQQAQEAYPTLSIEWRKASTNSDFIIPLTADAAQALTQRLFDILLEAKASSPAAGTTLPADVKPITYVLYAFPYPEAERDGSV